MEVDYNPTNPTKHVNIGGGVVMIGASLAPSLKKIRFKYSPIMVQSLFGKEKFQQKFPEV